MKIHKYIALYVKWKKAVFWHKKTGNPKGIDFKLQVEEPLEKLWDELSVEDRQLFLIYHERFIDHRGEYHHKWKMDVFKIRRKDNYS